MSPHTDDIMHHQYGGCRRGSWARILNPVPSSDIARGTANINNVHGPVSAQNDGSSPQGKLREIGKTWYGHVSVMEEEKYSRS